MRSGKGQAKEANCSHGADGEIGVAGDEVKKQSQFAVRVICELIYSEVRGRYNLPLRPGEIQGFGC